MTDKWVFIVNPVAGSGSAKSQLPKLEEMIRKNNIDAEIVFTERKGHASELSENFPGERIQIYYWNRRRRNT